MSKLDKMLKVLGVIALSIFIFVSTVAMVLGIALGARLASAMDDMGSDPPIPMDEYYPEPAPYIVP